MFDAEKLLSKVIGEVVGSGKGKNKKGKKRKKGSSGLVDSLSSGAGLMTIIGLGVGAYEILKTQKTQQSTTVPGSMPRPAASPPPPPPSPGTHATGHPPAVPVGSQAPSTSGSAPLPVEMGGQAAQEMACRMIQVMIAAAHADGTLDLEEEKAVLDRLRSAGLDDEEVLYLLDELHKPKTIQELTSGIDDPSVAKTMYMLALGTIDVDTEAERNWLDQLAGELGLSAALQQFMEGR